MLSDKSSSRPTFQSGDLLLCKGDTFLSRTLEWVGQSKYSHVGILLYQPVYLCETLCNGWYIWDSSYSYTPESEDQQVRYGIQIHSLQDIITLYGIDSLFVRTIDAPRDYSFYDTIEQVHKDIHAKPYNLHLIDWITAKLNLMIPISNWSLFSFLKNTNRFWCSAFVSYLYVRLGWISDVNWSIIAPREYSSTECTGQLLFTCIIHEENPLSHFRI